MAGSSALRAAEAEYRQAALEKPKQRGTPWPWYAASVLFFAADRGLKYLSLSHKTLGEGGPAAFTLFMNGGIAFSLPIPPSVFWPAAAVAMTVIVWSFARSFRRDPSAAAALFMVLCGAASNLADRVRFGATVDYFLFFGRSAVNVADGMIIGGLLFLLLRQKKEGHAA